MGYGVIGNTTVSGSVILGSSPGIPATSNGDSCESPFGFPEGRTQRRYSQQVPDDDAPASLTQRLRASGPIALVLAGSFVLYVWNLAVNQWANSFYTAAIWSGSRNFEAAFYGSLDPSNAMSVDKPPAAFWLPEILVRIFGLHKIGRAHV